MFASFLWQIAFKIQINQVIPFLLPNLIPVCTEKEVIHIFINQLQTLPFSLTLVILLLWDNLLSDATLHHKSATSIYCIPCIILTIIDYLAIFIDRSNRVTNRYCSYFSMHRIRGYQRTLLINLKHCISLSSNIITIG